MKIFKNKGDIYISKSKKISNQAKILYSLLALIVIFTVVFVGYLHKNYFSAAEFFARGEVTTTQQAEDIKSQLPDISGKTNFLILETDDNKEKIHYIYLLQADRDNKAYKAAALSPLMKINNENLQSIYNSGGGLALKSRLTEYFGFEIDYYADFDMSSFVEFVNKLGSYVYISNEKINYSNDEEDDKYTLKINEGEQLISGSETSNLLRYYSEKAHSFSAENEVILKALPALLNEKNYENVDALFKLFMKSCKTDITVREFENGKNGVSVFCIMSTDLTLYSADTEFNSDGSLKDSSIKNIKGYLSK